MPTYHQFVLIVQLVAGKHYLTMLNTQLVTGKHGLFWGHESEDIQTILIIETICRSSTSLFKKCFCHSLIDEGRNILQANNQMYPCLDVMR